MSANPQVERFEAAGPLPAATGESPVWRAAEQALYWVDIPAKKIVRGSLETGKRTACIAGAGLASGARSELGLPRARAFALR